MNSGKIIIFSDDPITGSDIAAMLTELGYDLHMREFPRFLEIQYSIEEKADLVLFDITPECRRDLIGTGNAIPEIVGIPAIFLVDPSDHEQLQHILVKQSGKVLLKPPEKTLLESVIRSTLKSHTLESRLNQRIEQINLAIEGSRIGLWDWRVQTGETIFNERWAEIIGYTLAELEPTTIETWERFVHPDDLKELNEKIQRHFSGELPFYESEARMKHKSGSWVYIHDRGKVTERDKEGRPVRMIGTHIDITDRRKTEERLIRKRNILDAISYAATSMMSSLNEESITSSISRLGRMIGVSRTCIFIHTTLQDGRSLISLKYEWVADGIPSQKDNPLLQNIEWRKSDYKRWVEVLMKGGVIYGNVMDFPTDEQFLLKRQKVRSMVIVPIYSRNVFFGFIGFEDYGSEHEWSPVELEGLQTAAGLLAASFARQTAEEEVRNREINFSSFFNTIEDFLFVLTTEGTIIKINNTVARRLGYRESELVGKPLFMVYPEEKWQEVAETFFGMLSGIHRNCSVPLISRNGNEIPVETRVVSGVWNGFPALFGVSKDISALTLSEEKFSKAFQSSGALMTISAFDTGRFIDVNQAFLDTLGYIRDEVIGKTSSELGLLDDSDIRIKITEDIRKSGTSRNNKVLMKTKDNRVMTGILSADVISIQNSEALLTVMNDVTEITRLSDALLQANKKLHLLSSVTRHDILNQVQALFLAESHLSRKIPKESPAREELEVIGKSVDTIHRQILFTRDYQDMGIAAPGWQSIQVILHNLRENSLFSPIFLQVDTGNLEIYADPMFPKVCFNLLENSLRHGGGVTSVSVSFIEKSGTGILIFEDNGVGISPCDKNLIFNSGFGKNTGFGLFLSAEILSITGITIQENGQEGKGARFEITIPKEGWRFSDAHPDCKT